MPFRLASRKIGLALNWRLLREENYGSTSRTRAQPDSKWQVYGKAEPFLTTGGGAVAHNDGLVAAMPRCATYQGFA